MIADYIKMVWRSLGSRKLRSWLTVIGVIIGIAAVVSLISLGQGLESGIEEQFSKLGISSLRVVPKGLRGPPEGTAVLTERDVDVVENVIGVDYVTPTLMKAVKILLCVVAVS